MLSPTSQPDRLPRNPMSGALSGVAFLLLLAAVPVGAQWRVESWFGTAWNAPTGVTFSQHNQPDITTTGHWSTRPFKPTWYYTGRIAKWSGHTAWALQYLHHKMYLDNPPPGVAFFRITNGLNFLLAERLWRRRGWEYGVGAGPVYAVPVSSVRGAVYSNATGIFSSRYELAGAGLLVTVARRLRILPFTFGSLALSATAATAHVHISNGHASTTNFALHIQYGLSLQTRSR